MASILLRVFDQEEAIRPEVLRVLLESVPLSQRTIGLLSSRALAMANSSLRFLRGVALAAGLSPDAIDDQMHAMLEFLHNQVCGVTPAGE